MLLELLISMVVLTVGLGGLLILMISAMYTDKRSGSDTASVMIAEHVLEQISAEPASSITPLQITDCTGAVLTINTAGALLNGGTGANGGNGANLTVDPNLPNPPAGKWVQVLSGYTLASLTAADSNPAILYACAVHSQPDTAQSATAEAAEFSERPSVSTLSNGGLRFIMPVTLRTIEGS